MNKTAQFSVIARCKSIHYAVQGIVFMLKTQHNACGLGNWLFSPSLPVILSTPLPLLE